MANPGNQTLLDITLYNSVTHDELIDEAEFVVNQEINRQFNSDPNRSEIEVMVLGHRNGDIIPILKTSVSRAQWQANPDVGAWTEYYRAYALFQRHDVDRPESTVLASSISHRGRTLSAFDAASIHAAYDEGRLTGELAQRYLDELD